MASLEENAEESLAWVNEMIDKYRVIAVQQGVSIMEAEDSMGRELLLPWLKMRVDLIRALTLIKEFPELTP